MKSHKDSFTGFNYPTEKYKCLSQELSNGESVRRSTEKQQ